MAPGVAGRVIAASCGLSAFAVALIAGLAVDNPAEVILGRALVCMIGVQVLGMVIGAVSERTVREAVEKYRASRPVPESAAKGGTSGGDTGGGDVLSV